MSKIAIVTDSNSGITQAKAKELGVYVLPMPFYINDELFYEDITLTQEDFYKKLEEDAVITTSQPAPVDVLDLWDKLLEEEGYDSIIHIPMSSGLSSSMETAKMLAADYEGKVHVIDNKRISVTQKRSVLDAKLMADKGMTADEIEAELLKEAMNASIYIAVDTLKYLKKGGRVTAAGAALGAVLNLKPVLEIQGEKLDAYAKCRGWKSAKKTMLTAVEHDKEERFAGEEVYIQGAYTCSEEEMQEWKAEVEARFPGYDVVMDRLSLSVSCHIGAGAKAVVVMKKVNY